ncbi:Serine/threonine-protein phosphatase 2A regulatory subunit B'' subunit gamma [Tritrichomonas musculus]|uniref:Serine/threonine-protein phosphatase 2A regulatory subunit B'' subunit gamma n=1 Tax=Tritrichomonas musculus TaxID=1915356 RepID=A0ABR2LA00_9EUKA
MAYIHTFDSGLQAIEKFGSQEEKEEYIKLSNSTKTNSQSILPFSFSVSEPALKLFPNILALINKVIPDIVSKRFCTEEDCEKYLKLILYPKKYLKQKQPPRFIIYNPIIMNLVSKKSKQILFSEDVYKAFVFKPLFFDFLSYSQFVKGIIKLNKDYCELLSYSKLSDCMLTLDDIGDFFEKKIREIDSLSPLLKNDEFQLPYYRQLALEQITFFFDPYGMNKVSPAELMSSRQFSSFLSLSQISKQNKESDEPPEDDPDNIFSYSYFISILATFTKSVNSDGLMDRKSFKTCNGWNLCDAFVDRVFETSTVYNGCLDFNGFVHFYVNYENSETPNGARYYFNLFDVDDDGLINPFDIGCFYKDLVRESGSKEADLEILIQELLDKTQATEMGFTLDQFVSCGSCEEIASILSDFNEFKIYFGHDDVNKNDR